MTYHAGNQMVDPSLILRKAGIQKGMAVADFGCGALGHMVFPMANAVTDRGMVYAVDIDQSALSHVERRMKDEGFTRVHTVWSDIERLGGTSIPEHSLDAITMTNVLCRLADRQTPFAEASRLLKDKGRIVVVDWRKESLSYGPQGVSLVDVAALESTLLGLGFILQESFPVGPYHLGHVFFRQR